MLGVSSPSDSGICVDGNMGALFKFYLLFNPNTLPLLNNLPKKALASPSWRLLVDQNKKIHLILAGCRESIPITEKNVLYFFDLDFSGIPDELMREINSLKEKVLDKMKIIL